MLSCVPILAYHKIDSEFQLCGTWNTPKQFEKHIKYLANSGYKSISVDEWLSSSNCNNKTVIITFDDGYENVYKYAYPILKKYGFSATIFLIVDFIGKKSNWDVNILTKPSRHLKWEQIKEMAENGIEFGSHSLSHFDLTKLNSQSIFKELHNSKKILEDNLGKPVKFLAYPYGRYNDLVKKIAKDVGYECAFSLCPENSNNTIDLFAIKRNGMYITDTITTLKIKLLEPDLKKFFWYEDIKMRIINWFSRGSALIDFRSRYSCQ